MNEKIDKSIAGALWRSTLFGWVLVLVSAVGYGLLCFYIPSPGKAVGYLAVIAAAATFRGERVRGVEKFFWMIVFFGFLLVELKAIDIDRAKVAFEQARIANEEKKEFQGIARGIQQTIKNSNDHFDTTMAGVTQVYSQATGGNSYFYLVITPVGGPIELGGFGLNKGDVVSNALPKIIGTYPLHGVHVECFGPDRWQQIIDYGTYSPLELGRTRPGFQLAFPDSKTRVVYNFFINTSNGTYSQIVLFLKVSDKWQWASYLVRYSGHFSKLFKSSGFPKDQLNPANWHN